MNPSTPPAPLRPPGLLLAAATLLLLGSAPALQAQGPSPQQQIEDFYTLCKQGKSGEALEAALSSSATVKEEDAKRVADSFEKIVSTMGEFVDYEIIREINPTKRVTVLRCAVHFENQPFLNEFTFYNPGDGWRVIHLRYDANPATMFQRELAETNAGK